MKGNIKRVLAATGLLVAALMIVVTVLPGSTAQAAGTNQRDDVVTCVNGRLILSERVNTGQRDAKGKIIFKVISEQDLGACSSSTTNVSIPNNTNFKTWTNEQIMAFLGKRFGMSRAQLDAIVLAEFGQSTIPAGFDLQAWFANFMANGGNLSMNSNLNSSNNSSTSSNSTSSTSNNSNTTSSNTTSSSNTNSSSTSSNSTGANSTSANSSKSSGSTSSNGGGGGASAPATLPTTGGGLNTVSPLVLALGALLVLFGFGVYKASATH